MGEKDVAAETFKSRRILRIDCVEPSEEGIGTTDNQRRIPRAGCVIASRSDWGEFSVARAGGTR